MKRYRVFKITERIKTLMIGGQQRDSHDFNTQKYTEIIY